MAGGEGLGVVDPVEEGGGPGPVPVEVEPPSGGGDPAGDVEESVADGLGGGCLVAAGEGEALGS